MPDKRNEHREYQESQRRYFEQHDARRFQWQTTNAYVAQLEGQLLDPLKHWGGPSTRLLEIGCGEGGNLALARMSSKTRCWVLDQSWQRTRFAAAQTGGVGVCGDGAALPFRNGSFDVILIRDVLHHVVNPLAVTQEAARVIAPRGRLLCIEPNGRNAIIQAFSRIQPAERRSRDIVPSTIKHLLDTAGFHEIHIQMKHALPLWRIVCHYKYGWPGLTRVGAIRRLFDRLESWSQRVIRSEHWSYTVACATKPP